LVLEEVGGMEMVWRQCR